jgi:hypothetical protein
VTDYETIYEHRIRDLRTCIYVDLDRCETAVVYRRGPLRTVIIPVAVPAIACLEVRTYCAGTQLGSLFAHLMVDPRRPLAGPIQ